jgi:hypothetical protein
MGTDILTGKIFFDTVPTFCCILNVVRRIVPQNGIVSFLLYYLMSQKSG